MGLREIITLFINPGVNAWASGKSQRSYSPVRVGCDRLFWTLGIPLNLLFQHRMARLIKFQDQLAEERVGPGKPGAREFLWVVLIERLVHESRSVMGSLKHP